MIRDDIQTLIDEIDNFLVLPVINAETYRTEIYYLKKEMEKILLKDLHSDKGR